MNAQPAATHNLVNVHENTFSPDELAIQADVFGVAADYDSHIMEAPDIEDMLIERLRLNILLEEHGNLLIARCHIAHRGDIDQVGRKQRFQ